jgi:hypothetical protein
LLSLNATPAAITPFQQSEIEWRVQIPSSVDPNLLIEFTLDNEAVAEDGSRLVSPRFTHTYVLKAKGTFAERELGRTTVTVNPGACDVFPSVLGATLIQDRLTDQLSGSTQMSVRETGVSVAFGAFSLSVSIPLEVEVPHWFNANMDVTMRYGIGGNPRPDFKSG